MNVYVSVIADRHTEPKVYVFTDRDAAIAHTREAFARMVGFPDGIYELPVTKYLLRLGYEFESDYAFCDVVPLVDTCHET